MDCSGLSRNAHAPIYPPYQCILKEVRESHRGDFVALHVLQLCCIHQTLRVTPAMAAGVSDRVWELSDIVKLLEDAEREQWQEKYAAKGPALGH